MSFGKSRHSRFSHPIKKETYLSNSLPRRRRVTTKPRNGPFGPPRQRPAITEPAITVVSLPDEDSGDTEENQDAVLQVASSDPDIIIYWLVGRNGE